MKQKPDLVDAVGCPLAADAVASALNARNHPTPAVVAHLATCPVCRREAAAARATAARLRAAPQATPSPDLCQRILDALPSARRRRFRLLRPLAAAAAVAALALGTLHLATQRTPRARAGAVGRNWLVRTQRADGLWQPVGTINETRAYTTALSALAALALERHGPANRAVVDRAIVALLAAQQADGAFGPSGRCRAYNHGMATAALLAIHQLRPEAVAEAPLRHAVAYIRAGQHAAGAWGYQSGDPPNTALTVWQTDALQRAAVLGWGDPEGHLRKAVRWLRAQQTGAGRFAYDSTPGSPTATLDAMGYAILLEARLAPADRLRLARQAAATLHTAAAAAPNDYYRDYFTARAFDAIGDPARAAAVRDRVAALQHAGGSTPTADRWSPVGGELYTTTLSLLTLP